MAHTHTYLRYHVVFSTASRRPLIDESVADDLHAYLGGVVREVGGTAHAINGVADHVHLLIGLPSGLAVAKAIQLVKTNSSRWMHNTRGISEFGWQVGYAAFTVSASGHARVQAYVENQAKHHREFSFQDELVALLKKHKIEYDPRFIFD